MDQPALAPCRSRWHFASAPLQSFPTGDGAVQPDIESLVAIILRGSRDASRPGEDRRGRGAGPCPRDIARLAPEAAHPRDRQTELPAGVSVRTHGNSDVQAP